MTLTKIALIAATVAVSASAASANNAFAFGETLEDSTTLDVGLVVAEGAGTVEIYDYSRGEIGTLLGTEMINAGANTDVKVNVGVNAAQDVLALLKVDGETVASREFDIAR